MPDGARVVTGREDEVLAFGQRNADFVGALDTLEAAFNAVFSRDLKSVDGGDALIFYLGRRCVDDFLEILLLCANGYGEGASSLLRGMYERAVTAAYLHQNPDESADFIEFDVVRRRRLAMAIKNMPDVPPGFLDGLDELESQYQSVRGRFEVTDCSRCGTTRINHTWSRLDFVSMAGKSGRLAPLVVPAYYLPLGNAHSTLTSVTARVREGDGYLFRDSEPDREQADLVLQTAHGVILLVLATQTEHFAMDALAPVDEAAADYYRAWKVPDPAATG